MKIYCKKLAKEAPHFARLASAYLEHAQLARLCHVPASIHFNVDLTQCNIFTVPIRNHVPDHCQLTQVSISTLEIADIVASNGSHPDARVVAWRNAGDATVYSAICNVGSFDFNGMVNELLRTMSTVKDKDGTLHQWYVSFQTAPLNGTSFHNVVFQTLDTNPLLCTAGSSILSVTCVAHDLTPGDFITFQNIAGDPGGVSSNMINGGSFQVLAVPDADHFTFDMAAVAYTDGSVGGESIRLGRGRPYAFVGRDALTCIGFPNVSGTNVATTYGLTAAVFAQTPGNVQLPAQLLLDHPDLTAGDIVTVLGLQSLQLSDQYQVMKSSNDTYFLQPYNVTTTTAKEARKRISTMNERDQQRVYFTTPDTFAMKKVQSNVFDSGSLFTSVNLAGDVYCFLTELETRKQFAKIQLRSGNGYVDFDTFRTTPFNRYELDVLMAKGRLQLMLTTPRGDPLYTNGLHFSGTLTVACKPLVDPKLAHVLKA